MEMVFLRYKAFAKPSSDQVTELDFALLRDPRTKASAQDLYSEAHDLIFRTRLGQPINADLSLPALQINTRPRRGCQE